MKLFIRWIPLVGLATMSFMSSAQAQNSGPEFSRLMADLRKAAQNYELAAKVDEYKARVQNVIGLVKADRTSAERPFDNGTYLQHFKKGWAPESGDLKNFEPLRAELFSGVLDAAPDLVRYLLPEAPREHDTFRVNFFGASDNQKETIKREYLKQFERVGAMEGARGPEVVAAYVNYFTATEVDRIHPAAFDGVLVNLLLSGNLEGARLVTAGVASRAEKDGLKSVVEMLGLPREQAFRFEESVDLALRKLSATALCIVIRTPDLTDQDITDVLLRELQLVGRRNADVSEVVKTYIQLISKGPEHGAGRFFVDVVQGSDFRPSFEDLLKLSETYLGAKHGRSLGVRHDSVLDIVTRGFRAVSLQDAANDVSRLPTSRDAIDRLAELQGDPVDVSQLQQAAIEGLERAAEQGRLLPEVSDAVSGRFSGVKDQFMTLRIAAFTRAREKGVLAIGRGNNLEVPPPTGEVNRSDPETRKSTRPRKPSGTRRRKKPGRRP